MPITSLKSTRFNGYYQLKGPKQLPLKPYLVIDTECTGLHVHRPYPGFTHPARPFLVATALVEGGVIRRTNLYEAERVCPHTREVFWRPIELDSLRHELREKYDWVLHNALFDLPMLRTLGIRIPKSRVIHDTLAGAHVLDSAENHELKVLCEKYLHEEATLQSVVRERTKQARQVAKEQSLPIAPEIEADMWLIKTLLGTTECEEYCLQDVILAAKLWAMQRAVLNQEGLVRHYNRERHILRATDRMMLHPLHLTREATEIHHTYQNLANTHALNATAALGQPEYNPRSGPQTIKALYEHFQLPVLATTKTGNPSTSKATLIGLENYLEDTDPREVSRHWQAKLFISNLLASRRYQTGAGYVEGYLERAVGNTVYPRFNPWGTVSTRFSSSDPNAQNVSNDDAAGTRMCFGPNPGHVWYSFDFNQIELRIMAHASKDPTLRDILARGLDVYVVLQTALNEIRAQYGLPPLSRKRAKVIWLAWQYGLGILKFTNMAGVPAEPLQEQMERSYPGVTAFMRYASALVRQQGYVHTLFGYRLYVQERLNPWTDEMERPEYVGTNAIIQGTAGDMLKNTILAINDYLRTNYLEDQIWILANIHDEIILEARHTFRRKETHLKALHRIISSAGDPIQCPTPAGCAIIRHDWAHPETLKL